MFLLMGKTVFLVSPCVNNFLVYKVFQLVITSNLHANRSMLVKKKIYIPVIALLFLACKMFY
jgi:hypothetical protein